MFSTDLLISALIVCFISQVCCDCNSDDDPVTDEQLFGKDNCCRYFGYEKDTDINNWQKSIPSAKKFALARLPGHRFDFGYLSETCTLTTVVPDNTPGEEVLGMAYVVPVADYVEYMPKVTLNCENGQREMCSVTKTVQVKIGEKTQNIKCSTFIAVKQPSKQSPIPVERRPSAGYLAAILQNFKNAGISQSYIDKVSKIPTIEG